MFEYYIDEKGIVHNHPFSFVLIGCLLVAAFFIIRMMVKNIKTTMKKQNHD